MGLKSNYYYHNSTITDIQTIGVQGVDLKDTEGHKILHLVDVATKYSVATKIPNKESLTIIKAICKYWIAYFGAQEFSFR